MKPAPYLAGLLSLLLTLPILADDLPGASKAVRCMGCHGVDGMKSAPTQPAIGGREPAAMIAMLDEYRYLRRFNPAMQALLFSMSNTDIADVADYFHIAGL
jgi:cytochrome c553